MTTRLELDDSTIREWDACVLDIDDNRGIVLDRSAFYPGGGGQPPDHGVLLWEGVQTRIVGARMGDDFRLIAQEGDPIPRIGSRVRGAIEDERRSALTRTHSALHVLSGIVYRDFRAYVTGSNMEPLKGRMDFDLPEVPAGFRESVEDACNEVIKSDTPVQVMYIPRETALSMSELSRSAESKVPDGVENVRIVDIVGVDTQADGGTHVASTSSIGAVRIIKIESKGRGFRRVRISLD